MGWKNENKSQHRNIVKKKDIFKKRSRGKQIFTLWIWEEKTIQKDIIINMSKIYRENH